MKKIEKIFMAIMGVITIIIIFMVALLVRYENNFSVEQKETLKSIIILMCGMVIIAMLIYFGVYYVLIIKRGIHNIQECDIEIFKNIDQYKKCWKEGKYYYLNLIQIINLYYSKGGKVDQIIENNDFSKLFERLDHLNNQKLFFENYINYFCSLVISIVASFVCQMLDAKNIIRTLAWAVVVIGVFFIVTIFRYAKRGQAGSYCYFIDEYEKELLSKKIRELEQKSVITPDDEFVLQTKINVLNVLIDISKKNRFKRKDIEKDINSIENLDLCMGTYDTFYKREIYVNNKPCLLFYDLEKGKESNYMGESYLISKDYYILYNILKKYNLISYVHNE